ncbi:BREX-1 system adenine-specific DNA-methyltransferase PglX [Dactylosporangium sp. AC04546]|uniref:Eco57I restriction-modification methylase domain-containing protein n=1 Tax=Dactylosporangium sp. AC04546 TaxID=2862460 RepID=UPI001EDFCCA9|nr:BREX-1 system adenine-specific DNA-methyltransferase PglX [Dactylosporangium sp. AC04546]WVK84247.1 BREX-1 system adenine-specific DNA-methyltransferase PglX [Dactylosporangium sp. AC04546]
MSTAVLKRFAARARVLLTAEFGESGAYDWFSRIVARRFMEVNGYSTIEIDVAGARAVVDEAALVLTPEVCRDVEVVGWLHQFYGAERKDEVFAGIGQGRKAGAAEIPAATQLFTPQWIVRYLVENSLGRLWLLNRPDSRLAERMPYYVLPVEPETDFVKLESPEELRVLDPACGAGHMLTYAFDLLCAIYEEEGYEPAEIPGLILTKNLYGVEIDPQAAALAVFVLQMKARQDIAPNIRVMDAGTFGSLRRDPGDEQRYHVVLANPPYLYASSMGATLTAWLRTHYPNAKATLDVAFIERALELAVENGYAALVTMQSWMFLSSYKAFREQLLAGCRIVTMAHLGARAFDAINGEVVSTTAFVLLNQCDASSKGVYVRLVAGNSEASKAAMLRSGAARFEVSGRELRLIPGAPVAYWLGHRDVFAGERIGRRFRSGGRTKTHDNERFVRYAWEVPADSDRWVPYSNGGGARRFYGQISQVVDWSPAARAHYAQHGGLPNVAYEGRPGLTWSMVGGTGFRLKPASARNSSGSPTLFTDDEDLLYATLALLNSSSHDYLLQALNPTVNTEIVDVLALPPVPAGARERLAELGRASVALYKVEWDSSEISRDFAGSPLLAYGVESLAEAVARLEAEVNERRAEMGRLQREINEIAAASLGLTGEVDVAAADVQTKHDPIRDLVSYSVGCMLGRFHLPTFEPVADNVLAADDIGERFRAFLRVAFGEVAHNLRFVERVLDKDIRRYFVSDFFKDHVKRYKRRPIFWMFSSPKHTFNALVYAHRFTPGAVLDRYLREARRDQEYEHHLRAAEQMRIDPGDGVKANYAKLGRVLRRVPGL